MFRIIIITVLICFSTGISAQHFDPNYNKNDAKTWRDSGYYFVPELIKFIAIGISVNENGTINLVTNFQSTDNSGLTYTGNANLLFPSENLPPEIEIEIGSKGFATIIIPQDLLFCPDEDFEQGMGQNDPYFPLSLAGRIEKVNGIVPESPIMVSVQLNDFTVN
jgi:hypothetical protein